MTTMSAGRVSYALAIAATAAFAVIGSVWAGGNSQHSAISAEGMRIDVSALLSGAEIANLPVLYVEEQL